MDDLAIVVKWSNRIEWLLKEHYHAKGSGLKELVDSSQERLPHDVHSKLRYIISIKGEALQYEGYKLLDSNRFVTTCKECEKELQPRSAKMIWRFVLFLIFAATAGAIWFYIENWGYITGG